MTQTQRRFPVFPTLKRAFELLWIYRAVQLRTAMPALILLSVAVAMGLHKMANVPQDKVAEAMQDIPRSYALLWLVVSSAGTFLLLMYTVTWRRFLLHSGPLTSVTFNKPFRRYLVLFVLTYFGVVFGATVLAGFVMSLVQSGVQDDTLVPLFSVVCVFASLAAMMLLATRFLLLFTATAIDHKMKLREAAAYMKGNVLRYAGTWLLLVLVVNFANNLIGLILNLTKLDPTSTAGAITVGVLSAATMGVTASLTASLAALVYDYLVRGGGPDITEAV